MECKGLHVQCTFDLLWWTLATVRQPKPACSIAVNAALCICPALYDVAACSSHKAVSVIHMTSASVSTITVSPMMWLDVLIMPVNSDNVLSAGNKAGDMRMQRQDQQKTIDSRISWGDCAL